MKDSSDFGYSHLPRPARKHVSPRKRPLQARSQATVEALLKAASQVLVRDGYERMTTTRVAERAGVSVGSLYQYFPSKEALLVELLERRMAGLRDTLLDALQSTAGQPFKTRVRELLSSLLEFKAREVKLGIELARQTPRLEKLGAIQKVTAAATQLVAAVIEEHRAELKVKDSKLAAWLIVQSITGILDAAITDPPLPLEDPRLIEAMVKMTLELTRSV